MEDVNGAASTAMAVSSATHTTLLFCATGPCCVNIEGENEPVFVRILDILRKSTDFLRRIVVPVEGRACALIATDSRLKTGGCAACERLAATSDQQSVMNHHQHDRRRKGRVVRACVCCVVVLLCCGVCCMCCRVNHVSQPI